jgi:hypothetical protein
MRVSFSAYCPDRTVSLFLPTTDQPVTGDCSSDADEDAAGEGAAKREEAVQQSTELDDLELRVNIVQLRAIHYFHALCYLARAGADENVRNPIDIEIERGDADRLVETIAQISHIETRSDIHGDCPSVSEIRVQDIYENVDHSVANRVAHSWN